MSSAAGDRGYEVGKVNRYSFCIQVGTLGLREVRQFAEGHIGNKLIKNTGGINPLLLTLYKCVPR